MTDGPPPPPDGAGARPAPGSVAEHDARRCVACGARCSSFGFGPPLSWRVVWACRAHRVAVGRALAAGRAGGPGGGGDAPER